MNNRNKFIFLLIVIQPIIDLVTSLSTTYNISITVGALLRTVLMACLFIYITRYLFTRKKRMVILFIASYMAILIMLIATMMLKQEFSWFQELNFALKTSYYLIMIYTTLVLIMPVQRDAKLETRSTKCATSCCNVDISTSCASSSRRRRHPLIEKRMLNKELIYQSTKIISLIIGVSYWLAIVTETSINSYRYESVGYSGWFASANELSVIVLILLTLTVINLRYEQKFFSWIAFILMLSMVPMIGTKTAFLGGGLIVFVCVIYLLFKYKLQLAKDKNMLLFLTIVIIFVCLIPLTPIASNTQDIHGVSERVETEQNSAREHEKGSVLMEKILSSRNLYFQDIKEDFAEAQAIRKAFGLGYAGDYGNEQPKLIEMDFFDLFFSYGLLGSVLLLMPLAYLFMQIIKGLFPLNSKKALLVFTLCICLGIAFLAGHVLFAPSVMTYLTILLLALGNEIERNDGVNYGTT